MVCIYVVFIKFGDMDFDNSESLKNKNKIHNKLNQSWKYKYHVLFSIMRIVLKKVEMRGTFFCSAYHMVHIRMWPQKALYMSGVYLIRIAPTRRRCIQCMHASSRPPPFAPRAVYACVCIICFSGLAGDR